MSISNCATEAYVSADRAIVGTLCTWVTIVGPTEGLFCEFRRLGKQSILLLKTIPNFLLLYCGIIPDFIGVVSEVSVSGNELLASVVFPVPGLAHNNDVVTASEGVSVVRNWLQNNLRLVSDSLISAGAIIVPLWKISK